jgi:hypothetical protein
MKYRFKAGDLVHRYGYLDEIYIVKFQVKSPHGVPSYAIGKSMKDDQFTLCDDSWIEPVTDRQVLAHYFARMICEGGI